MGARELFAMALEGLARSAFATDEAHKGVFLTSAAAHEREAIRVPMPPADQKALDAALTGARNKLGDAAYAAAWSDGKVRPVHDVVAEAINI